MRCHIFPAYPASLRTEHFELLDPPRTFRYVEAGLRQEARLNLVYESEDALVFEVER